MSIKTVYMPPEESDELIIKPLGSGQEVGRSCHILEFKGKTIMLDCGLHPGYSGLQALPFIDVINPEQIDLLLISHFHLDHCGSLPWFLEKTQFKGRCFMTHASKAIYRWLLSDYVKVSNLAPEEMLYTDLEIEKSMDKIETLNFHQEVEVNGIKFWCYTAGHVLGAAMFMIEIAGVRVLYTGDFSCQEDRHLMAAEIPSVRPDVLICESTYGTHIHEPREDRESRFTGLIHNIINRGGRCLIPVFALGRAQELLLIIDEYWGQHPELHDIPVYYASSLAKRCMSVYQTYISAMNESIREKIAISNPFVFKHISNLKSVEHFDDVGPSVVMASPGMMQSGISRELFEMWCTDKRNGVIIAGYCVENTLAKQVLSEPDEVETMKGNKLPRRCSVDYISFSAHTDFKQTSAFIRALKPPHLVLVHGEKNEMARLKAALEREYEEDQTHTLNIYDPKNTQPVKLHFRGEKMAKVVGSLAATPAVEGRQISGVLVKRGFNFHVLDPKDLSNYTELVQTGLAQRVSVAFTGSLQALYHHLGVLVPRIEQVTVGVRQALRICRVVTLILEDDNRVTLEWETTPLNDMYADMVIAALLKCQSQQSSQDVYPAVVSADRSHLRECLLDTLTDMFGSASVSQLITGDRLTVTVDDCEAVIGLNTLDVYCEDETLQQMLLTAIRKTQVAIQSTMPEILEQPVSNY